MEGRGVGGFLSLLLLYELEWDYIMSGKSVFHCKDNIMYFAKLSERVQVARIQQLLWVDSIGLQFQLVLGLNFWKTAYKNSNLQEKKAGPEALGWDRH